MTYSGEFFETYHRCMACCRELTHGTRGLNIQVCGLCEWSNKPFLAISVEPIAWSEWNQ